MDSGDNTYDAIEYPGYSYPDTHPDQLAVMAALHGLTPAPVANCRVLEIGCSEGANLIPMAYALPDAQFTGFDLAAVPIARGQKRIRELGLRNIRLFQGDILQVGSAPEQGALGEYDYIIAHGLYAWIPAPVRERLLALCAAHLASHGVVFVSYNALPGGHIRSLLREVLQAGAQRAATPQYQATAGIDLLELVVRARPEADPLRRVLEEQITRLRRKNDHAVIFHDELSPAWDPVSVAQFVQHARRHELEYLSEAVLPMPNDPCFQPKLMQSLAELAGGDVVAEEELLDFVRMRMYRETLLVRAAQPVEKKLAAAPLRHMRYASMAASAPGQRAGTKEYTLPGGVKVNCHQPPVIAVVERLIAVWPRTLGYPEILEALTANGLLEEQAPALLQQMAFARLIELHLWEPPVAAALSERPRAAAASRQEAHLRLHAANLWHGTVQLDDPVIRALLRILDGTRNRAELLASLREEFPSIGQQELEGGLEPNLKHFLEASLLEA